MSEAPGVPNSVTLEHPSDPDFSGEVTFRVPTVYEQIAIGARRAQLSGPAGFEALSKHDQLRVTVVATLEYVIATAPKGFLVENNGLPFVAFDKILEFDDAQLFTLYQAYMAYRNGAAQLRQRAATPARPAPAPAQ